MASVTLIQQPSFKKTSTPNASNKRKIATILDVENVENLRLPLSPAKAAVAVAAAPPINNSSQPVVTVVKKTFTGTNISALNNQTNIINNQQQPKPKARTATKLQSPKSAAIINTSEAADQKPIKAALPQAVARRNARERNRVKQVNNGFAALRQHIPKEMAESFEQQKSASGAPTTAAQANAQKKLSKVETLRMAVEYIRNLESLLNISSATHAGNEHSFSFCDTSSMISNSPSSPSFSNSSMIDEEPSLHPQPNLLPFESCESLPIDQSHVVLPSVTTINGLPYLRLPPQNSSIGGAQELQQQQQQGFIDPETGDFVFLTVGDEDQAHPMLQPPLEFPAGMDQPQPIILYAPAGAAAAPVENNFQSNFVNNNLLAPAYLQGAEEFNGGDEEAVDDECSGQSTATAAAASPVPGVLRIKIEQEPSRGNCPSSSSASAAAVYANEMPLMREMAAVESPPKRHCSEQFSVVDQSGVIIRGNFIEIKQEELPQHFQQQQQQLHVVVGSHSPDMALSHHNHATESMYDHERLLNIKTELRDEESDLNLLDSHITEEHMIDAMEWWAENERKSASN